VRSSFKGSEASSNTSAPPFLLSSNVPWFSPAETNAPERYATKASFPTREEEMSDSFDAANTAAGLAWARGCRATQARNLSMGVAVIVLGKGTDVEKVGVEMGKCEDGGHIIASGC